MTDINQDQVQLNEDQVNAQLAVKTATEKGFVLPEVAHLEPIPAGANPFHYDLFNMGTSLVRGWMVMHGGYDTAESQRTLEYLILVNTRTGQRIRITGLN